MRPCRFIILALPIMLYVGCASTPPLPSQASFTQQVLDPRSSQIANQKIAQRKAELESGRIDPPFLSLLCSPLAPLLGFSPTVCPALGSTLSPLLNSSLNQDLALLESRRSMLKEEIFTLYQQRTKRIENGFAVCVEGQEWQYVAEQEGFIRSRTDGPGPCEQTPLKSLQLHPWLPK